MVTNLRGLFEGQCYPSPLLQVIAPFHFVDDDNDRILADISLNQVPVFSNQQGQLVWKPASFELAGPRRHLFWHPKSVKIAIVTCGGLAPGLNNVIQNLVNVLMGRYGVEHIYGVPFGYRGFMHDANSKHFAFDWLRLDEAAVANIDSEGGSILGTSRGFSDPATVVDALLLRDIQIVFAIGGEGTLAGAYHIYQEIAKRHLPIGIVGIPKTIDNDVPFVSKTFGFSSAVEKAAEALRCAQTEARSVHNGVGLVKLMGRGSGALTATAALATSGLDFALIPEVPLVLDGEKGFLQALLKRVQEKGHATVAVAEGAGQNLFAPHAEEKDLSGNIKPSNIGYLLKGKIAQAFQEAGLELALKYIDPSYMQRAQTTTAEDAVFCTHLSQNAVHAAMAGKTGCLIGYVHERFTHVPLQAVSLQKKNLDIHSPLWLSVLAATGQAEKWGY